MGIDAAAGPTITGLVAEGPAAKAGVRLGDVVESVDKHDVDSMEDVMALVRHDSPGQPIVGPAPNADDRPERELGSALVGKERGADEGEDPIENQEPCGSESPAERRSRDHGINRPASRQATRAGSRDVRGATVTSRGRSDRARRFRPQPQRRAVGLPAEARPYAALGERLGISEPEVRARIAKVKVAGVLRQLSAIFDTRALGYSSALVAAKVDPDHIDEAAA